MKKTVTLDVEFLTYAGKLKKAVEPGYWHIDPPLEVTHLPDRCQVSIDMFSLAGQHERVRLAQSQAWFSIWFFKVEVEAEEYVRVGVAEFSQPNHP